MVNTYKSGSVGDTIDNLGKGVYVKTLPFVFNDNTETTTGWNLPANSMVIYCVVEVETIDATETMDVGVLSDDPNAIGTAVALGVAGFINDADALPYMTETQTAKTVSYTCSAGSDTSAGNIHLVYVNMNE